MGLFDKKDVGRLGVFSILDMKAQVYSNPWFAITDGTARRSFADLVNDPQSSVSKHPEDYCLYRIGNFDDLSGILHPETPQNLGIAATYLVQRS